MKTGRVRRTAASAGTLALLPLLLFSACNDSDDDAKGAAGSVGKGETSSTTPGSDVSDDSDATPSADPESEETTEPEEKPSAPEGDASCLIGSWSLDNDGFAKLMEATAEGGVVDDVSGSVLVSFAANGTTTTAYDDWTHVISTNDATVTINRNGTDEGTWKASGDGTMVLADVKISSKMTSKMNMNGQEFSQPVPSQPSVLSKASFTCTGDKLDVTAEGATTTMRRVS